MASYQQDYDAVDGPSIYLRVSSGNYPQRQSHKNPSQRPESFNDVGYSQNYRLSQQPNNRKSLAKLNEFRKRVHEVVDLCRGENNDVKGDINQVITEERKIYDMLNQNSGYLRRTVSYQSFPQTQPYMQQQTLPYGPSGQSQRREQLTTPFRPLKNLPQSQYFVPGASQVGLRDTTFQPNIAQSNLIRPDSGYLPQSDLSPYYGTFGPDSAPENLQGSFLKLKNTKQIHLNEDALRLIEDIQRKAFEEIERLRKQKLELMQRLNVEIRNLNEEKRKNAQLQSILNRYSSQPQRPDGGSGDNTQHLQSQITRLEADLQRANELNKNLRLELSSQGSGVPGIEQLLRQGQAIRQQTLKLLKQKEQGETGQRVAELERMLQAERSQKEAVLNEVKALRERQGSQTTNVRQQQSVYTGLDKSSARGRTQQGKSVGQYEDLVSQMKRITGF